MSFGLQEGTIFAGRYKVLRCIASGGMGAVYEVLHLETERRRALKVMHAQMLQSPELRDRFKREARVAAKVDSEFIVDVFDAGVDDATQMPFLVMELLKGEELGKLLKRRGRFSPQEVVTYLKQMAMALDKTHKASIVHRDLKPANLFLTHLEDGQPRIKVLDFGVAKIIADSGTAAGGTVSLGTPLYMSPEQFNPQAKLSGAADIYALGMMAYTLLVGSAYWATEAKGGNLITFALTAVHGPPEPASVRAAARGVALPPAFDGWFFKVTARDPAYRYPTATAAIAALAEALGTPLSRASSVNLEESGPTPVGTAAAGISQSGGAHASPMLMAGAPTPIGASMTSAQPERRRGPIVAAVLALGGVALVAGGLLAFVLLRSSTTAPEVPVAAESAAPAAAQATTATVSVAPPAIGPASASALAPPSAVSAASLPSAKPLASAKPSLAKPLASAPKKETKPAYSQD